MRLVSGLLAVLCLNALGCAKTVHSYDVRDAGDVRSQWNSFFLFGNVGTADVDVAAICGPGQAAAWMGIGENFGTVLLTILTLEIYSPKMAYVSCGAPIVPQHPTAPSSPPPPPPPPPPAATPAVTL